MEFYLVLKSPLSFYFFHIFKADIMTKHIEIAKSAVNQIIQVWLLPYYILLKDDLLKKFKNKFLKQNSKIPLQTEVSS